MSGSDGALHSNLALRIAATLVLAPLAIAAAWLGGWPWRIVAVLVAIGLYAEWLSVIGQLRRYPLLVAGIAALVLLAALLAQGLFNAAALTVAAGTVAVGVLASTPLRVWSVAGFLYAAAALAASLVLRADAQSGFVAIALVFAVVWASDILGYVCGRSIGGAKLWERISPKKTWAGAIGGFLGSIAVAAGFAVAGAGRMLPLVLMGAVLSIASQSGDLAEFAVKRRFDVKDSSNIIPGHGGLMDRLDGFVAAVVIAALIGVSRSGPDAAGRGLLLW